MEQPISRILSSVQVTLEQVTIIHLWMPVARHLLRPTRELGRAVLKRSPIWSCTGWGLHSFPGHPGNWCALTAPFHPYPVNIYRAVYFLLHFPSRCRDSTLWSTLPYGVRTFLRITGMIRRSFELLQPRPLNIEPSCLFVFLIKFRLRREKRNPEHLILGR